MDFFTAFNISASALSAQRIRMNVVSSNLANAQSTETPEGGPYRRKDVVFSSIPTPGSFPSILKDKLNEVSVVEIVDDQRPFKSVYDPYHPSADQNGYVYYPNINIIEEMVNLMSATRSYEANVSVIKATKSMALKALEIGR
ncbi:MAG: flagellar basal body rod protein FlgC [Desulfobacterota bacterium]|nr:flagellar basal body rod protein FlgC [Thermodesulfobacteriota bacterium]